MMYRQFFAASTILLLLFLTACGGSGRLRYEDAEQAYTRGMENYERGRWDRAAEFFRGALGFGRATAQAADAQYYLAWSHYNNREYVLAASEFNRFSVMYRTDERAPEAEFYRAMSYYQQAPGYQLDQTDSQRALQDFQLYVTRYPNHEFVPQAEENMAELRDKLARKQFETAKLYERRRMHEAAALMFERVFDRYPDSSPWAERALVAAMENFIRFAEESVQARQAERYEMAVRNYERLIQLFPGSEYIPQAEQLYRTAVSRAPTIANN
jgi:outer membrane protein assembly factor BamD